MKPTQAARHPRLTWAWLLCLALMLPLAQLAGAAPPHAPVGAGGGRAPPTGAAPGAARRLFASRAPPRPS